MFYLKELILRSFYFLVFIIVIIFITIIFKKTLLNIFFGGLIKFDEDTFTLYSTNFDSFNSRLNNGFSEPLIILIVIFIFVISIYFLILQAHEFFCEELIHKKLKKTSIVIIIIIFFSICLFIFPNIWIMNESISEIILNTYDGEILSTIRNQNEYIFFLSECFNLLILTILIGYVARKTDNISLSVTSRDYNIIFLCFISINLSSYLIEFLIVIIFVCEIFLLIILIKIRLNLDYLLIKINQKEIIFLNKNYD